MIVMKFGGTSVQDANAIRRVGKIIESRLDRNPAVVVSAMGKITDELLTLAEAAAKKDRQKMLQSISSIFQRHENVIAELNITDDPELMQALEKARNDLTGIAEKIFHAGQLTPHLSDQLVSLGEFLSANILAAFLRTQNIKGAFVDARDVIVTDSQFGKAVPLFAESQKRAKVNLEPVLQQKAVPVLQGFVGMDSYGRTTTLGRGGSDYSATFIGSLLKAEEVEIWSDVDGILTADPTLVPEAKRIRFMSFQEAAELAYFGAKVLHPNTLLPAIERGIPVYVLNSTRPDDSGTLITYNGIKSRQYVVKSIAYKEDITIITVTSTRMLMAHGFLATIFDIFDRYQTPVDLVSTSEVSVSMTIDQIGKLQDICRDLSRFSQVDVEHDKAIVCLVGEGMKNTPGMATRIFSVLADVPIHLISQGASEINISFVIDQNRLQEVVSSLHNKFFSGELDPNIFAV